MALISSRELSGELTFDVYSPDTPHTDFGPGCSFKTLWDSKRHGGLLPAWRDFQFEDFDGWYGWLSVEDILTWKPYDSVFRLWGTNLVDVFGVDITNMRRSKLIGTMYRGDETVFWEEICRTGNVVISSGTMNWLDHYHRLYNKTFVLITFPLADDGRRVDKYLSVTVLTNLRN